MSSQSASHGWQANTTLHKAHAQNVYIICVNSLAPFLNMNLPITAFLLTIVFKGYASKNVSSLFNFILFYQSAIPLTIFLTYYFLYFRTNKTYRASDWISFFFLKPCMEKNPCLHNGTCVPYVPDRTSSVCLCQKDWAGDTCELSFEPCRNRWRDRYCNHGRCFNEGRAGFYCRCHQGWYGSRCSTQWPNVSYIKKSHVDLAESVKSYIILQKNRLTEFRLSVFFFHI